MKNNFKEKRVSLPDFDLDFIILRLKDIIEYVKNKNGHDHVVNIINLSIFNIN